MAVKDDLFSDAKLYWEFAKSIAVMAVIILLYFSGYTNTALFLLLASSLITDIYLSNRNKKISFNDISQIVVLLICAKLFLEPIIVRIIIFPLMLSNVLKVSRLFFQMDKDVDYLKAIGVNISIIILLVISYSYFTNLINFSSIVAALSISLLLSAFIVLIDNKYIYIILTPFSLILLHMLFFSGFEENYQVLLGIGFAMVVAFISIRLKFLTITGSIATFVMAGMLFGFGGIKWSVPILTFFILSSLLSKVRKKHNEEVELYFEKSGVRDHWQVMANGGLGVVCLLLYFYTSNELYYLMNIVSLAAVCADTWATEIGTYKRTNTYNILTFKPIEQGRSGGISITGTFGSFLGASVIALSGLFWIQIGFAEYFFVIILLGILGSFVDSIIGATIQHQLKCNVCEKITEKKLHCGKHTTFYSGFTFINNDIVNFVSAVVAVLILFFMSYSV